MYLWGGDSDKRGHSAAQDAPEGFLLVPGFPAGLQLTAVPRVSSGLVAPAPCIPVVVPAVVQPPLPRAKGWCTHLNQGTELLSLPLGCGGTDMGCA